MDILTTGIFLAAVNKKIVDFLAEPIKKRFPNFDLWWLMYVALITGAAISWVSGVNLFVDMVDNDLLGQVLSAILVGGGSSLIHDIFDNKT